METYVITQLMTLYTSVYVLLLRMLRLTLGCLVAHLDCEQAHIIHVLCNTYVFYFTQVK